MINQSRFLSPNLQFLLFLSSGFNFDLYLFTNHFWLISCQKLRLFRNSLYLIYNFVKSLNYRKFLAQNYVSNFLFLLLGYITQWTILYNFSYLLTICSQRLLKLQLLLLFSLIKSVRRRIFLVLDHFLELRKYFGINFAEHIAFANWCGLICRDILILIQHLLLLLHLGCLLTPLRCEILIYF